MSFDAHANFAYSTVATAPSPATSGTTLVVAAGDGAKFPTVPFNVVIWPVNAQPSTTNAEIARATLIAADTFTITRAQEGTAARTVIVGDQICEAITAKSLTDIEAMFTPDLAQSDLTPAVAQTVAAGFGVVIPEYLEIPSGTTTELLAGAFMEIT